MRRKNVVLLGTDSADSRFKSRAYGDAARKLGLSVREQPDRNTLAIIPTSDSRALHAAWMCAARGIPGPSPLAVAMATSKSLTYEFLRRRGFALLSWLMPSAESDLEIAFDGPVILKPDAGSGSTSQLPWGYRVFDCLKQFRRYLHRNNLARRFFSMQSGVRGDCRCLLMEYVDTPQVHSVATVAGDGAPVLYDTNVMRPMPDSKVVGQILVGVRHPDTARAVSMAAALAEAGLRRSVIYLQCMERGGRLYPIDLNLRPGAMWALTAARLNAGAFEELLAVMLGYKEKPEIRWPAPYVGIARVPTPLRTGRFRVEVGAGAVPLVNEIAYDSRKFYDVGHAWPMLAMPCERPEDFGARLAAASATTRLTRVIH